MNQNSDLQSSVFTNDFLKKAFEIAEKLEGLVPFLLIASNVDQDNFPFLGVKVLVQECKGNIVSEAMTKCQIHCFLM